MDTIAFLISAGMTILVFAGICFLVAKIAKAIFRFWNPSPEDDEKMVERYEQEKARELQNRKIKLAQKPIEVKATSDLVQRLANQHRENPFINNRVTVHTAEKIAETFYFEICSDLQKRKKDSENNILDERYNIPVFEVSRILHIDADGVYETVYGWRNSFHCYPSSRSGYHGKAMNAFLDFKRENLTKLADLKELKMFAGALQILVRELITSEYQKNPIEGAAQKFDLIFTEDYYDYRNCREIGAFVDTFAVTIKWKASNPHYVPNPPKQWH